MQVLDLQKRLKALGYDVGALDGLMGPRTIAAIKAAQASAGLKTDGVVGPKTLAALDLVVHRIRTAPATVSPACVDLVKAFEGIEDGDKKTVLLEPYVCPTGYATVGWGHVLHDAAGRMISVKTHGGRGPALAEAAQAMRRRFGAVAIDRDQAKALLAMDLNSFAADVAALLSGPVSQNEFDALVSLAFNVGTDGFAGSTVRRMQDDGRKVDDLLNFATLEVFSRAGRIAGMASAFGAWAKGDGRWMLGLFRRRMAEAMLHRGDPVADAVSTAMRISA